MKTTNFVQWMMFLFLAIHLRGISSAQDDVPKTPEPLGPGDHNCSLMMGESKRSYLIHIPGNYDSAQPTPVVLALHGAAMNASMMIRFCGMNKKSDDAGFIVVYPNGTGVDPLLTWNAGNFPVVIAETRPDDVAFIKNLIDELSTRVTIDKKRTFACGMSNGAMMCYRLAAELSDCIASIAPVAGTVAIDESNPKRPVSVIHFHGTKDTIVPFEMPGGVTRHFLKVKGVEESIQTWVKLDDCVETPTTDTLSQADDAFNVTRKTYGRGKEGTQVVLVTIKDGGHTWPGQKPPISLIGKSAMNISANDLIWEFFQKHPMK